MNQRLGAGLLAMGLGAAGLAGCASGPGMSAATDTGLDRMERLAVTANRCWFRSKDPAFASYSLAPELSSFSGRPRFLIVPRGKPEALPLLVVEGRTGSSDVSTYGPLLNQPVGARVSADLARWRAGGKDCMA